ncbi:MAG: hypothetical protein ABSG90_10940 [Dehalococcoidia bacterium]
MKEKKCFVIMPFSDTDSCTENQWTDIFNNLIKPAVENADLGYKCSRSSPGRQNIIASILASLNEATVVIADLTDSNPNVYYELGVRHTLANRTLLIAQGKEHIPFDLSPYPAALYKSDLSVESNKIEFSKTIKDKLLDIENNPELPDNPVADFLKARNIALLSYEKMANSKMLASLLSELSYNMDTIDSTVNELKQNRDSRKQRKGVAVPTRPLLYSCLDLLLTTMYVNIGDTGLVEMLWRLNRIIKSTNARLELCSNPAFGEDFERELIDVLPDLREVLKHALIKLSEIRISYVMDNYVENPSPTIVFADPEHGKIVRSI